MHVALLGTGKIGQFLSLALIREPFVSELSLIDIIPGLSTAVSEEVRHACVSAMSDIDVYAYEKPEEVTNADFVVVSAGFPRTPDMKDRTELITKNAQVMKDLAEKVAPRNPQAKWIIVTNPVDSMASVFAKYSKADFVISAGTTLDTLRFRAEIAKLLKVPNTSVEGFVGGEHGAAAVFLWSTVKVGGVPLVEYLSEKRIALDKEEIMESVKEVSRSILKYLGGTTLGPASAFKDIVRAIALSENKLMPVGVPYKTEKIPKPIHVSIPMRVGRSLGPTIEPYLTDEEKTGINHAAEVIWKAYDTAIEFLEKS